MTGAISRAQMTMGALCLVLFLALGYQMTTEPAAAEIPPATIRPAGAVPPPPIARALPPLASFSAIDARPLFAPDRKALPPPDAPRAQAALPTELSLIGVIIDKTHRLALVRSPSAAVEMSLSVGQSVNGWTVSAIEPDHVVLRSGGTDFTLDLFARRAAGSAPPGPSVPLASPQPPTHPN